MSDVRRKFHESAPVSVLKTLAIVLFYCLSFILLILCSFSSPTSFNYNAEQVNFQPEFNLILCTYCHTFLLLKYFNYNAELVYFSHFSLCSGLVMVILCMILLCSDLPAKANWGNSQLFKIYLCAFIYLRSFLFEIM